MHRKFLALILAAAFLTVLSLPAAGLASDPAVPVSAEPITVTLADLCTVAQYITGQGTLSEDQMKEFELTGDGRIDLSDLKMMAAIFIAERAPENPPADEPNPEYATVCAYGTIESVDEAESTWYIKEDREDAADEIGAIISDDTMIVDYETGDKVEPESLRTGMRVSAFLSLEQMPSLPPRSACDALIVNIPAEGSGNAQYVCAAEIAEGADGAVRVLNQNKDLWVTLPAGMELDVLGSPGTRVPASELTLDAKMTVWYDSIAEVYPSETTAVRAVIMNTDTSAGFEEPDTEHGTVAVTGTISSVDEASDTWFIKTEGNSPDEEIGAVLSDETAVVDYETGQQVSKGALTPGTRVTAYLGMTQMPSLPPKSGCAAVVVNEPSHEEGMIAYVYALEVSEGENNSIVVLNQNRDMLFTIPESLELGVVGAPDETASASDVTAGTRMFVWYDVAALSFPARALAVRAAIIPDVPEEQAEPQTVTVGGKITEIQAEDSLVLIQPASEDAADAVGAIISDDTIIISAATGETCDITALEDGETVTAYLGMEMMPSIPPKAACRALIVGAPEGDDMQAAYVQALEVRSGAGGSVGVLNQNGDLVVSIPENTEIGIIGHPGETASASDITQGSRLIVWHGEVLTTYPAQTTAVRAMIMP